MPVPVLPRPALLAMVLLAVASVAAGEDPASFPGPATDYHGFAKHVFVADGQHLLVVEPKAAAPGRPWIWRCEFFDHEPQGDLALLAQGWHVVHDFDAAGHFGAPAGVAAWEVCYHALITTYGLSPKPLLEGFSRGGTLALTCAVAHPEHTGGLYLDAPMCDLRSMARKERTPDQKALWDQVLRNYGLTDETVLTYDQGPLDHLAPLVAARIPILLICGDADMTVPYATNGGLLAERYRMLGGNLQLILKAGGDHHPHSLKDPAPIVTFALEAFAGKR
jgi:pimeloyl-ACP methyl ester carboxylesterase